MPSNTVAICCDCSSPIASITWLTTILCIARCERGTPAIRAASATPTLLKLLEQSDWSRRTIDIKKDAIRALGEIRASGAVPALTAILGKRRFLRRALNDELRAAAAAALGEINEERGRPALEKALQDRNPEVARAAAKALAQLEKDSP